MTDREAMQMALVQMGINQYSVAELAPHKAVMAFNSAMEALRAQLEQPELGPVALIRDGVLRWYIPHEHYSRPAWTAHSTHMLYTHPPQRKPLTEEEIWEIHDRCIPPAEGYVSPVDFARAIETAHGIGEEL